VRFRFANGTASDANPPRVFPLFGRGEEALPWDEFVRGMEGFAIADTASWCRACGETTGTCAAVLGGAGDGGNVTAAAGAGGEKKGGLSTAVAGVIGALVTLVVILGIEALVMGLVGLRVVKKGALRGGVEDGGVVEVKPKV
jgi:hypothetical protein